MDKQNNVSIKVDKIYKSFKLPHEKYITVKSTIVNLGRKRSYEEQVVLKNINFEVKQGEFFGIVGRNGSGKSTLLKLLAGIYSYDRGSIEVRGTLTPFIELGVGFSPELTGRENIFLNGALLGFDRQTMQAMYDDIVKFAELERFMDQKLKNYSSGMQVRLAFSIAIRAQSNILLIDEVLAVGDAAFQRKCFDHFMELKKSKKTVILVTHDMGAVRQYCDRAIMIDKGKITKIGKPAAVAQAYLRLFIDEANKRPDSNQPDDIKAEDRWGNGKVRITSPRVLVNNKSITMSCTYEAKVAVPPPVFGFSVYNPAGVNIVEGNTLKSQLKTKALKKGDKVSYEWNLPNIFANGKYDVSFACCDQSTTVFYDWLNKAASIIINKETDTSGVTDPPITTRKIA